MNNDSASKTEQTLSLSEKIFFIILMFLLYE